MPTTPPPFRLASSPNAVELALLSPEPEPDDGLRYRCSALWSVQGNVWNGGMEGLVDNPTGELVPDALIAAHDLGATKVAAILEELVASFPSGYPLDLDTRIAVLDELEDEAWDRIQALASDWPEHEVSDAVRTAMASHPKLFWTMHDTADDEAVHLLEHIVTLVGAARSGDAVAEAALDDVARWAERSGNAAQRKKVESELQRLTVLRR